MSWLLHCKLAAILLPLFYFSFHLNKHLCRRQKRQPNHKVHNYHVQTWELQATLYFLPSVSLYTSFIQTRTMRIHWVFAPSGMSMDSVRGKRRQGLAANVVFHLLAFKSTPTNFPHHPKFNYKSSGGNRPVMTQSIKLTFNIVI